MEAVKDNHVRYTTCKYMVYIIFNMLSRPITGFLTIKNRLLHVVCICLDW